MTFTYVLYQDVRLFHRRHLIQSSGRTADQRVTGHIYTVHDPKSYGSGRGDTYTISTNI